MLNVEQPELAYHGVRRHFGATVSIKNGVPVAVHYLALLGQIKHGQCRFFAFADVTARIANLSEGQPAIAFISLSLCAVPEQRDVDAMIKPPG